jgi:hypothetical protein
MNPDLVLDILRALQTYGVEYAVVGGIALTFQGLPRATADIDLFVRPDADNVDRLKQALRSLFDDEDIEEISAEDLAGAYPAIQYVPPDGTFHIDILARLGDAFRFEDVETEERQVEGVLVRLATPQMLYRMKKDTVRLQDRADAARLRERFSIEDEE